MILGKRFLAISVLQQCHFSTVYQNNVLGVITEFFYSISEGIAMGVISYVAINLFTGKAKEKKISVLMFVLALLFIGKYILL